METTGKKALIVLAHGFEEIEAITPIDVLRRCAIDITIAGLDYPMVSSARGISLVADTTLEAIKTEVFDLLILPGGEPGTTHLEESALLKEVILNHVKHKKYIAAICAAPRILNGMGLLKEIKATSFPGTKDKMTNCTYSENRVEQDGLFITSRGPGTALEFSFALVDLFRPKAISDALKQKMVVSK